MEEYTLPKDWGKEECYVFTKVTCMFQAELNILLDKHFSRLCVSRGTKSWKSTIPKEQLSLPVYGVALASVERQDLYYADTIMKSWGPKWPTYATNDVYSKFPSDLVDFKDPKSSTNGYCFYVNKFDAGGETCEWLMTPQDEDRMIYSKVTGKIVGKVRTFTCLESVSREEEMVSWVMEEYSVLMNMKKGKVICVIKQGRYNR